MELAVYDWFAVEFVWLIFRCGCFCWYVLWLVLFVYDQFWIGLVHLRFFVVVGLVNLEGWLVWLVGFLEDLLVGVVDVVDIVGVVG